MRWRRPVTAGYPSSPACRALKNPLPPPNALQVAQYTPAHNIHFLRGPFYLCINAAWSAGWQTVILMRSLWRPTRATFRHPAAVRWMKKRRRPVHRLGAGRVTAHRSFVQPEKDLAGIPSCDQFDALITYSRRGADEYAALGFPAGKIFVAPNAASPRPTFPLPIRPPAFERAAVRAVRWTAPSSQADRQSPASLRALGEELQPRLVIVGDGPERLTPWRPLQKRSTPRQNSPAPNTARNWPRIFQPQICSSCPGQAGWRCRRPCPTGCRSSWARGTGRTMTSSVPPTAGRYRPRRLLTRCAAGGAVRRLPLAGNGSRDPIASCREEINLENMVGVFVEALNKIQ